jgi:hypothetical protein
MSHALQADPTEKRRGAAVSFATKDEAMAYIVSLGSHDIPVLESHDPAASQSTQSTAN